MKRFLALLAVLAIPAMFLVSCGGDDDSASSTTAKSSESSSGSSDTTKSTDSKSSDSGSGSTNTGNAKVDKFCNDAKALAEKSKKAIDERDTALAKEAADDAKSLSQQAGELTSEVMKDPSLGKSLADCTKELSDVGKP